MLRMYFLANGFNLADEACEEALYDVSLFRAFCRIDLGEERAPDAATLLNFRHLLEAHDLGAGLFARVVELLQAKGVKLSGGTIVDATLIAVRDAAIHTAASRSLISWPGQGRSPTLALSGA
jgi:IS5 family transposase